ncbi:hypothetical protein Pla52o_28050 [Novipirellula galeiformis]|uniref:Uncharacterized protein n=1 Tax=Novipirellula galeiformis TaxID=2528004 RepID=A0A5C6CKC0_9BACT|nr:hypothetical protein [Novipirellula galeiformis]TWU23269.1 hypothetical protein Pla52o_28050 [Novipirellula galeiformis]
MISRRISRHNDIQARDAWFASLSKGRESMDGENVYVQAFWPELAVASPEVDAGVMDERARLDTAIPAPIRGLRERLSRFGV